MKRKQLPLCFLFLMAMMHFGLAATTMNGAPIALIDSAPDIDFKTFLTKFTSSAAFQYSRIKFPLASPIYLLNENGDEVSVPFTQEEWPLLDKSSLKEGKVNTPDGVVFGNFVVKNKDHVEFEAGLEESELDLSITFDLIDGKWYVTDCYNGWYGSIYEADFDATVYEVQQKNEEFIKKRP